MGDAPLILLEALVSLWQWHTQRLGEFPFFWALVAL